MAKYVPGLERAKEIHEEVWALRVWSKLKDG